MHLPCTVIYPIAPVANVNNLEWGQVGATSDTEELWIGWPGGARRIAILLPPPTSPASAAGSIELAGSAAAAALADAAAVGSIELAGIGQGSATAETAAAGSLEMTGAATGIAAALTSAAGSIQLAGAAAGSSHAETSAAGSIQLAGSATGSARSETSAAGSMQMAGAASGDAWIESAASGGIEMEGAAATAADYCCDHGASLCLVINGVEITGVNGTSDSSGGTWTVESGPDYNGLEIVCDEGVWTIGLQPLDVIDCGTGTLSVSGTVDLSGFSGGGPVDLVEISESPCGGGGGGGPDGCPCTSTPASTMSFPLPALSDGVCTNCTTFASLVSMDFQGGCEWQSTDLDPCNASSMGDLQGIGGTTYQLNVAGMATYECTSFHCSTGGDFALISENGDCSGWPATITVTGT